MIHVAAPKLIRTKAWFVLVDCQSLSIEFEVNGDKLIITFDIHTLTSPMLPFDVFAAKILGKMDLLSPRCKLSRAFASLF